MYQIRKLGENVREGHLVFISDDKHDVPFVEKCNEILQDHYMGGFSIDHNIKYNDGCGMQFKCIQVFTSLARCRVKTSTSSTKQALVSGSQIVLEGLSSLFHHVLSVASVILSEMLKIDGHLQ